MGFLGVIIGLLVIVSVLIFVMYLVMISFGFCLLAMGITGLIMNKISESRPNCEKPVKDLNILLNLTFGGILVLISLIMFISRLT